MTQLRLRSGGRPIGRFHVLTDTSLQARFSHAELACLVIQGGADAVQYREKRPLATRELVETASQVADTCRAREVTLVVNDRVDVAWASGAAGVHLGRNDLSIGAARSILGSTSLVGATANSLQEARVLFDQPIDYLGVGPVFGTASKANPAPTLGIEELAQIASESPVPVIAIGSITPERVRAVLAAGAHGVAVLSGVVCAEDPAKAARVYADAIKANLRSVGGSP